MRLTFYQTRKGRSRLSIQAFNPGFQSRLSIQAFNPGFQSRLSIQASNLCFKSRLSIQASNPGFQSRFQSMLSIQASNPGFQSRDEARLTLILRCYLAYLCAAFVFKSKYFFYVSNHLIKDNWLETFGRLLPSFYIILFALW